jgi:hypothetical protein
MARPNKKQGFRPIIVDGVRYRWRYVDFNRTADLEVYLETESSARGQRLCVNFDCNAEWRGRVPPFTPRNVAIAIRAAIARGWRPLAETGDFQLALVLPATD